MITQQTQRLIGLLAEDMAAQFTPPEYIPGCKVKSIADKDQYATDNGWVEALCGRHNQQRCRWIGQIPAVAVDDFIDVIYYPSYATFIVAGQGGAGAAATGNYLLTDGTRTGATTQAQDFGVNGIEADTIAESTAAAGVTVDGVKNKDGDVFTADDVVGLRSRLNLAYSNAGATLATIEDFNAGLPSGWNWAGSPFLTPAIGATTLSSLVIGGTATATDRSFFYAPTLTTANRTISLSLSTASVGTYGGLRWDDGSDDNYVELRLQYTATNTYSVVISHRTGGGTPVTTTGWGISLPIQLIIQSQLSGTYWTSWNMWMRVFHLPIAPLTLTSGYLPGATWTPTRWGIVVGGFGATWQRVYVDWVV